MEKYAWNWNVWPMAWDQSHLMFEFFNFSSAFQYARKECFNVHKVRNFKMDSTTSPGSLNCWCICEKMPAMKQCIDDRVRMRTIQLKFAQCLKWANISIFACFGVEFINYETFLFRKIVYSQCFFVPLSWIRLFFFSLLLLLLKKLSAVIITLHIIINFNY